MIYKAEDGMVCSTREKLCMKKFRQALQREASALRRSCLTTIATNMLASILITAVISNGFLAAASPFVPAKPQHPTAQRQMSLGIPVADRPERIVKLLSLFDEAQKSAIPTADPKISGIKGLLFTSRGIDREPQIYVRTSVPFFLATLLSTAPESGLRLFVMPTKSYMFGKSTEQGATYISTYAKMYGKNVETEGVNEGPSNPPPELNKDLLEISPLRGKNFWKPSLPTSWKLKRACFWKYCIERK